MIKGFVQGQTLKLSQTKVVAGSIDYLIAKFTFNDADWGQLEKWMHLKKGESVYAVRLQNDRTKKEDHLNLDAGEWSVWLHGNSQEEGVVTERITTNVCTFTVEESGVLSGDALPELPAGIGEQVMARMEALEAQMEKTESLPDPGELENGRVLMIVNGEWQAADAPKGADVVVDAELSETSENPVQNKVITQTMNAFADVVEQAIANVSTAVPTFNLVEMGLPTVELNGMQTLRVETSDILAALEKGPVKFILAVSLGMTVEIGVVMNSIGVAGEQVCTCVAVIDDVYLLNLSFTLGEISAGFIQFGKMLLPYVSSGDEGKMLQVVDGEWQAADAQNVPASIDMSAFDSEGKIVETFENGTSKTSVIEFDEGGNPVKITDGDGNVTVLAW